MIATTPVDRAVASAPQRRRWAGVALLAAPFSLAATAAAAWFEEGRFIAAGDIAPFIREGFQDDLFELWNHRVSGSGSATTIVGHAYEVGLLRVTETVGIPATEAQRIHYTVVAVFAVAGAMYLARAVTHRPLAVATAGVVALFNPLSASLLPNPLPLVAVGTAGLLGGLVIRAAAGSRPPVVALAGAVLPVSYLSLNPPLLVVVSLWVLAMALPAYVVGGGASGVRRAAGYVTAGAPLALLLNVWWVVPTLLTIFAIDGGVESIAVTDVSAWAWTHTRAGLGNVVSLTSTWTWGHAVYAPWSERLDGSALAWTRFALPALAFAAPLVLAGRARRAAASFLAVGLAAILLMKGLHEPLAGLNQALYDLVPGSWLFREPVPKLGVALVLVYALLAGLAVDAVWVRVKGRLGDGWAAGVAVLCIAVSFVSASPVLDGSVIPAARGDLPDAHVRVPDGWHRLADTINDDPAVDKVLVLPLGDYYQMPTTWGFYGTDATPSQLFTAPVIQRHAGAYFGAPLAFEVAVTRVEAALLAGDVESVRRRLRDLSVTHVVVRNDFDRSFPGRLIADPLDLRRPLESMATSSTDFSVARLFTVAPAMRVSLDGPAGEVALSWRADGPGEYTVRVPGPTSGTLVLREGFSRNWRLTGADAEHSKAVGYANGWHIDTARDVVVRLEYWPSKLAHLASLTSAVGGTVVALALVVTAGRRGRRGGDPTAGPRRHRQPGQHHPRTSASSGP